MLEITHAKSTFQTNDIVLIVNSLSCIHFYFMENEVEADTYIGGNIFRDDYLIMTILTTCKTY